jgi:hypothetical protein
MRMLTNDELVKLLEATVVCLNILVRGFSIGIEGGGDSRNAQSSGRNLDSRTYNTKQESLLHLQFSFLEVKRPKCKTDHSLHVVPGLRNLGRPYMSVGPANCCWTSPAVILGSDSLQTDDRIVECRPVAEQRLRDKQIYKSRYSVTASQTNMFLLQQLNYNSDRCFLCGPCRDIISRTSWELQLVEFSQSEE